MADPVKRPVGRPRKVKLEGVDSIPSAPVTQAVASALDAPITKDLVNAIAQGMAAAIEATRPQKKTFATVKPRTPWTPTDGSPKLKLKRKMYQHGMMVDEDRLSNDEINALNKLRLGDYCDNTVHVRRRKDRGIDIDYPIKTQDQQLRLIQMWGIRNLKELAEYCSKEADAPKKPVFDDEGDAF